jgi:hypothetical protein
MAARPKTKKERLFAAAVVRRSFELQNREHRAGFQFVYEGVLRDLGLDEAEVDRFLAEHRDAIEVAVGRKK